MYIDVHTHAFHPKIAHKAIAQLETHYSISPKGTGTLEDLLERVRDAGIDRFAVHSAATDASQVIPANNWAIDLQRQAPEVIAFGTMHPDFDRMEAELDRLERNGIKGLKFHCDFQGFFMDDPAFMDILEATRERFVIMLHVGDRLPPEKNPSCPKKLAALRRAFPDLTLIAAHMGGYLHWQWALEHLCGLDIYFDTSSTLDFIDDSLLRQLFDSHPRDRILFGSDYPLFDPREEMEKLQRRLSLSASGMDTLLSQAGSLFA